jgi:hypothetical protein
VPDEPTTGEVYRRLQDHETRTALEHRAIEERITRVASESVPLSVWQQAERARDADMQRMERERVQAIEAVKEDVIQPLRERVGTLEKLRGMSFGRWVGALGVVAAFLAVVVTAWAATKGAK